ncbi:uncharacterized protein LOC127787178 [Diospyros lotus]|uniref:uncharacterized protein LOC127787178 n=1 Tax=Diospyros lotus TaxID=55363 RepID=UPI00224F29F0|nr:uncharacterized protein LOC127787178 [Diospyros lotus]
MSARICKFIPKCGSRKKVGPNNRLDDSDTELLEKAKTDAREKLEKMKNSKGNLIRVDVKDVGTHSIIFGVRFQLDDPDFYIQSFTFIVKCIGSEIKSSASSGRGSPDLPYEFTVEVPYAVILGSIVEDAIRGLKIGYQVELTICMKLMANSLQIPMQISSKGIITIPKLSELQSKSSIVLKPNISQNQFIQSLKQNWIVGPIVETILDKIPPRV